MIKTLKLKQLNEHLLFIIKTYNTFFLNSKSLFFFDYFKDNYIFNNFS